MRNRPALPLSPDSMYGSIAEGESWDSGRQGWGIWGSGAARSQVEESPGVAGDEVLLLVQDSLENGWWFPYIRCEERVSGVSL